MPGENPNIKIETNACSEGSEPIALRAPLEKTAPAKERRHAAFFDVINASLAINSPEQFCAWAQGELQNIFPHGMLACGIGLIENLDGRIQQLITRNFPREYFQGLQQTSGLITSPLLTKWITTRRPVLFEMYGATREIADVHFLNDNVNTWYLGAHSQVFGANVTMNLEAIMLPLSRGYGSLPSLHLAMTDNPALLRLVKQLAYLPPERIAGASALVENILFEWAGVAGGE